VHPKNNSIKKIKEKNMKNFYLSLLRKLFFIVLFFGLSSFNFQIVNIPDANFKAALLAIPGIDDDGDTFTDYSGSDPDCGSGNGSSESSPTVTLIVCDSDDISNCVLHLMDIASQL
jgi:hypothetical protein